MNARLLCVKATGFSYLPNFHTLFQKEFIDVGKNHCTIFAPDYDLQATWSNSDPSSFEAVFACVGLVMFKISKRTINISPL